MDISGYSPLNHFVSELGEVGVAAYAAVFNTSLIFSGLILVVFLGGLSSWLLAPTLVTIASFASYLFLSKILDPTKFKRPKIMAITTLEWLVFVSIIAWIVSISIDLILS